MTHTSPEVTRSGLTPAQAADVIRYYDASENEAFHANNWQVRKIKLGQVAIHTTQARHSIIPHERPALAFTEPTLTVKEAAEGLENLLKERDAPIIKQEQGWPIEPTTEQWDKIDKLIDNSGLPLDNAYAAVMGVWPN